MAEDSTQPPHAIRFIETTQGVLSYSRLAPLLAERVLKVARLFKLPVEQIFSDDGK